jgi:hypothetical protein
MAADRVAMADEREDDWVKSSRVDNKEAAFAREIADTRCGISSAVE